MKKYKNKKTGEIIEGECFAHILKKLHDRGDVICRGQLLSMDLFAEYWEEMPDYRPTEPLVEYEKERNTIRIWAEAVGAIEVRYDVYRDCIYVPDCNNAVFISFDKYSVFEKLKHGHLYTITELCGK